MGGDADNPRAERLGGSQGAEDAPGQVTPKTVALVGAGRAGAALGVALQVAGWDLRAVWSRSSERAERVAALLGCAHLHGTTLDGVDGVDVVLLAVPDDAISVMAAALAGTTRTSQVVLHTSGCTSSTVLELAGVAAACGSVHPLAALPDALELSRDEVAARVRGIYVAVEGADRALATAEALARDLGATPVQVRTSGKALYHAGAVVLSNYLVTLFAQAERLLQAAGVSSALARPMLVKLAEGALGNVATMPSSAAALTGPARRGDVRTVARHLQAMDTAGLHDIDAIYRALLPATVELAVRGGLSEEAASALLDLVRPR